MKVERDHFESLEALRGQIDGIDEELVTLLLERFRVSEEIARAKAAAGYRVTDEDRESYVLEHVKQTAAASAEGGVYDDALERIFRLLIEESKGRQRQVIGLG